MRYSFRALFVSTLVLITSCRPDPSPSISEAEPAYLNLNDTAVYVGKEVCGTCHSENYNSFIQAEMGRSFRPATLTNSNADFSTNTPIYDPHSDFYYLPFNNEDALYLMEYRLNGQDTVHKRIEKIDYIVGSGQHTNSHIMEENGYLYQMPLTWYAQDGKWDLPPKFAGGNNSRFSRPIPEQCMSCHNAVSPFVKGSENRFTEVAHGIDCERCHGPGSFHVEEKMAGKMVDIAREIDYTIVNPAKLPVDLQFDICQNCHMQGVSVFKPGKSIHDFRPGLPMSAIQNVFWPRYADSIQVFTMASHPDRLKMSACFQESHARTDSYEAMTCITCHDVHVSIETLGPAFYNETCQSCHTPVQQNLCTEEQNARAATNDNCISCHMPISGSEDIPHVRVTDHFIRTPDSKEESILSTEEMQEQKQFVGMASLVESSPSARDIAESYLTYYEEVTNHPGFIDSAQVYLAIAQNESSRQDVAGLWIWSWFWEQDYRAIINLAQSIDITTIVDAWTLYRIGEAYLAVDQPGEAIRYLEQARQIAPNHLRFLNKLASAYRNNGQLQQALSLHNQILEANPKFDTAYNDRGFTYLLLGDFDAAEADFHSALSLDPDIAAALGNLASLYLNTERKAEARPYAQRLLTLYPNNPDYLRLWNLVRE